MAEKQEPLSAGRSQNGRSQKPDWRTQILGNKRILILCLLLLLFGCVAGYRYHAYLYPPAAAQNSALQTLAEAGSATEAPVEIAVHVKGAVQASGVYRFATDARVEDAVLAAEALPTADLDRMNLAAYLKDGSEVIVPYLAAATTAAEGENPVAGEAEVTPEANAEIERINAMFAAGGSDAFNSSNSGEVAQDTGSNGKININTASSAALQRLNGIGEVRAAAIISYRETNGAFASIDEIMQVNGIGEGIFSQIKDDICVD